MYDSFLTESGGSNGSIRVPVVSAFQNDETLPADDYGTFSESCSAHCLPVLCHFFTNIWQGTVSDNSTAEHKNIHYVPNSFNRSGIVLRLSKLAHTVMLLTCIWEVPSSHLGWDTNYNEA
jgi:hypothetical protein